MKQILYFIGYVISVIFVIFVLWICCEVADTNTKSTDRRYIEYIGHPNLYHRSSKYDVVKLNDTIFICLPRDNENNVTTVKIKK